MFRNAFVLAIAMATCAFAQGTFTDSRDGKKYKTVEIGSQIWMAQNLDYHGEDGFLGLCYGDVPKNKIRKPENCKKYGRLYDWEEALKACPSGWHLPSYEEWQTLVDFAGGDKVAGKKLKAKNGWVDCGTKEIDNRGRTIEGGCLDAFGFSALPSGNGTEEGNFFNINKSSDWWSSTTYGEGRAYRLSMSNNDWEVYGYGLGGDFMLFSVRCLHGSAPEKSAIPESNIRGFESASIKRDIVEINKREEKKSEKTRKKGVAR